CTWRGSDGRDGLRGAVAPLAGAERRLEPLLELAGFRPFLADVGAADQLAASLLEAIWQTLSAKHRPSGGHRSSSLNAPAPLALGNPLERRIRLRVSRACQARPISSK